MYTGLHISIHQVQRKYKSGACCTDIKSNRVHSPQFALHQTCCVWNQCIRRTGCHNDQIQFFCLYTCGLQCSSSSLCWHGCRRLFYCNMTLTDTGSAADPLIAGIHDGGKKIICYYLFRQATAGSYNLCSHLSLHLVWLSKHSIFKVYRKTYLLSTLNHFYFYSSEPRCSPPETLSDARYHIGCTILKIASYITYM